MMRPLKPGDLRPFVCPSACRSVIPAQAALAGSNRVAWLDCARSFRPTFGQAWDEPAATPG